MKSFLEWKLMDQAIPEHQLKRISEYIMSGNKLTSGENVKKFEKKWSEWLGCKHSVFVNSGSSANFLAVHAVEPKSEASLWVSQACTWSTTISPILLKNDRVQLCDVNLKTFGPDMKNLEKIFKEQNPKYLFLVHLLGFNCYSDELQKLCDRYGVTILEDCCEAHGASYNGIKAGNFGKVSTFSFYYGHHMTTIEGGMVCTNDDDVYEKLLLLRSHGLMRELPEHMQEKYMSQQVDPDFTFLLPGYNVRSTDINAILGLDQIEDLDERILIRNKNFTKFINEIDPDKYECNFDLNGMSNFSFPIIRKDKNVSAVKKLLKSKNIQIRPIIAGSLYEHPMIKSVNMNVYDKNSSYIHSNGLYVGNNHTVTLDMVDELTELLNEI